MARWLTFWRQAFVTTGALLNLAQSWVAMGNVAGIIPLLKQPDSLIPMTEDTMSWFTTVHWFTYILGIVVASSLMEHYGRRVTNIVVSVFVLVGWICIVLTNDLIWVLISRIIQGITMGLIIIVCPVMIGECSSPKNRGVFLTSQSVIVSLASLSIIAMTSYLYWRTCALIWTVISFVNVLICIYSPESPSWLASRGRYDDCTSKFRWLRGSYEEKELERLIKAGKDITESKTIVNQHVSRRIRSKLTSMKIALQKKEVYKPIILGTHLCTLNSWCGLYILMSYSEELFYAGTGKVVFLQTVAISMEIFRLSSITLALYLVTIIKRKNFLVVVCVNILLCFSIAGYSYVIINNFLPFHEPYTGIILINVQMISIVVGAALLTHVLLGEIFPLEYRSASCGFSTAIGAMSQFLVVKTFPNSVNKIGISGCYLIYGVICTYCLVVVYILLPETKDRTLQDIEDEFKGVSSNPEDRSGHLLTDVNE